MSTGRKTPSYLFACLFCCFFMLCFVQFRLKRPGLIFVGLGSFFITSAVPSADFEYPDNNNGSSGCASRRMMDGAG